MSVLNVQMLFSKYTVLPFLVFFILSLFTPSGFVVFRASTARVSHDYFHFTITEMEVRKVDAENDKWYFFQKY